MDINTEAVDEVVLALLFLNRCEQNRAWKSFDWAALNRLHEKGFIHNPVSRTKSVGLTEEGLREAERLFTQYFVRSPDPQRGARPT
ncbi:hypothetical protein C6Q09_13815 [Burkholderia multivorans]|uniref:DUF6429 family protein n=1 Tax=Burkholderia cepacia complex TaxID=87882 RepID=UPI000D00E6C8|nr:MULTISPECIES: DUF6429 family protein [Burkholderia cepacia complex]MDN7631625.1 DUF6429 family protein [Burkholderia cenocepacia]PRF70488.1 hypothetical protein C6Q09_13815 [Burkholderia multivorans]